jgi:hypothetical protein
MDKKYLSVFSHSFIEKIKNNKMTRYILALLLFSFSMIVNAQETPKNGQLFSAFKRNRSNCGN